MIKWKKINIFLIFFNFQILFIQSYITLPFEYINKNSHNSNPEINSISSYYESYLENSIYTTIKVHNKNIKFYLSFDRHATYISETTLNQLDIKPTLLYDYEKQIQLYSLEYIGIPRTSFGYSPFELLLNNSKNISLNNFSFFISKEILDDSPKLKQAKGFSDNNEEIGLNVYKGNKIREVIVESDDPFEDYYNDDDDQNYNPYDSDYNIDNTDNRNKQKGQKYINKNNGYEVEESTNIINQLKNNKLISSYAFTIKYDQQREKGEIIIGSLPHEYDPRHYSEKFFVFSSILFRKYTPAWRINFNQIKYAEEKFMSSNLAELNINFGFISTGINNKQIFDLNFFLKEEIAPYCKEEKINSYYIKTCEEKVIKEFKPVSFDLPRSHNSDKGDKIEFSYEDLFIKCPGNNNLYCFQIIFGREYSNWILGKPLFKKYNMVFDQEKKIVGFYKEIGEYQYEEKETEKKSSSIPWIIVVILLICLFGLGFAFYKKLPFIKRKRIANELDDEFVYELAVKKNGGDKKDQLIK
jgi:hypothetical protein